MGQRTARDTTVAGGDAGGDPDPAGRGKPDLSVTQVAGTSLATVAAALLASELGVYGTILGAGVVSVVATAGGPVIQHVFRRTGDQFRGSARPAPRPLRRPAPVAAGAEPLPGEFGRATVHAARGRGHRRRRTAALAGAAFVLSLGALGTYEAVAGTSVSSDGATLFSGGTRTAPDHRPGPPSREPGKGAGDKDGQDGQGGKEKEDGTQGGDGGRSPEPGNSPGPSAPPDGGGRSPGPVPPPSGGPSTGPSTAPATPVTPVPSAPPGSGAPSGPSAPAPPGAGPRDGS